MMKSWHLSETEKQFLNQVLKVYLQNRPLFYSYIRPQEALLFLKNQAYIKSPILDFGCGDGFFAYQIFGKKVIDIGLDVASSRILESPQHPVYRKIVTYDGRTIPFPNNYFQTVISNCVFEHLPYLDKNLAEIYRVLKPGGTLLVTVATDNWEKYFLGTKYFGKTYSRWWRQIQVHPNLLTHKAWEQLFTINGFNQITSLGYISPKVVHKIEMAHYLSWPSSITYKIFHRWVLWPNLHQYLRASTKIIPILSHSLNTPTSISGANFYALIKS